MSELFIYTSVRWWSTQTLFFLHSVNADSDTVILTEEGTDLFDGMGDILTSGPPWARGVSKQQRGAPVSGGTMN